MNEAFEKAKLIFLDEIAKQMAALNKSQQQMLERLDDVQAQLGRRRKFRAVPDRNSTTGLIEEVVMIEETAAESEPTALTPTKVSGN